MNTDIDFNDDMLNLVKRIRAFFELCSLDIRTPYEIFLFNGALQHLDISFLLLVLDARTSERLERCVSLVRVLIFDKIEISYFLFLFADFIFILNSIIL